MDWERTKTVFILAFLLLNTFFAFQLWLIPTYFDNSLYVSAQQIEAKLTELKYKNITVTAEMPRRLPRLRILTLRQQELDMKSMADAILGYGTSQVPTPPNTAPGLYKFLSEVGEAVFYTDGRLTFTSRVRLVETGLAEKAAWAKAEEYLDSTVGKPGDAVRGRITQMESGAWLVEYGQRWRGKDLDVSRITIVVDNGGILEMDYYWVDIVGYSGVKAITIPPTGALTVAADILPPGSTITHIYHSWYSSPVLAKQWSAYPVWVIVTAEGSSYYVNAFTGDLEGNRNSRQENLPRR